MVVAHKDNKRNYRCSTKIKTHMNRIKYKNLDDEELIKIIKHRFNKDFNEIALPLLERAYPNSLLEKVIIPNYEGKIPSYPMWNTLFEARTITLGKMLKQDIDKLASIGIYLMEVDELHVMMFITGCGYDFYKHHWLPLYKDVLEWV